MAFVLANIHHANVYNVRKCVVYRSYQPPLIFNRRQPPLCHFHLIEYNPECKAEYPHPHSWDILTKPELVICEYPSPYTPVRDSAAEPQIDEPHRFPSGTLPIPAIAAAWVD
jgi:hypothetical protein